MGTNSLSTRFRNINIALFTAAFFIMAIVTAAAFNSIIGHISTNYARHYAASSAESFSAHISSEIDLIAKMVRNDAVADWLVDENNDVKKRLAYERMSSILGYLYSNNLYIGVEKSLNEYKIDEDYDADKSRSFAVLDKNDPDDAWYFDGIGSDNDYILNIGIDDVLQRKRVWLNYRIVQNGVPLGVISTGLEFSHVVGELFAHYDNTTMRGLIIDENGIVNMDSSLLSDEGFLHSEFGVQFEEEFSDPALLAAMGTHFDSIEGYFRERGEPAVVKLSTGRYRYAAIAPIRSTSWAVVIFYDPSSALGMSLFLPIAAALLVLLIVFAFTINAVSYRLIFMPLEKLVGSLTRLKENNDKRIYGIERNDEIGNLSNTILDLFTKANHDALTGIYNRRFMENNFQRIMELLTRSHGLLSVLMVDVDFFKKYNDTYGHEQGDVCLKSVARSLADTIMKAGDFAARYGGEEFVAVLPDTNDVDARRIAEKLLENVRRLNMPHAGSSVAQYVTVSVGVATGKVLHEHSWEDYLKRADEALYTSKQNGRNRYTFSNL